MPRTASSSKSSAGGTTELDRLVADIRACRLCIEAPAGKPLPHEPRPVLRVSATARIAIAGQAPGTRVHKSGIPFTDPSGVRLRQWMGVTDDEFYDVTSIAIIPMGFCFPGLDAKGGDLAPRRECAPRWRAPLLELLPRLELILLVGQYAHRWHLETGAGTHITESVRQQPPRREGANGPRLIALPHPSWRNNAWLRANPWFEAEVLPDLQQSVRRLLDRP